MSWNDTVIEELIAGKPRIAGTFDREFLILLGTVGARTGQPRTSPVACFPDGDRLLIVASKAGADTHPAWYHNLLANPEVQVRRWEDGHLAGYRAAARPLDGEERQQAWDWIVERAPGFGEYQTKTDRVIPVVELRPQR